MKFRYEKINIISSISQLEYSSNWTIFNIIVNIIKNKYPSKFTRVSVKRKYYEIW